MALAFYFLELKLFFGQGGKDRRDGLVYPGVYCPHRNLIVNMDFNSLSCLCFCE